MNVRRRWAFPASSRAFLAEEGFGELYPPQEAAVEAGLLEGKSLVIASPTASGKTLIAMMAAYKKLKEGRKVVYLSPLRALASEKYAEFKKLERFGVRCAIATGDFDGSGEALGRYDFLVLTNEKFDSILTPRGQLASPRRALHLGRGPPRGERRQGPDPRDDPDEGDPPRPRRAAPLALGDGKQPGRDRAVAQVGPGAAGLEARPAAGRGSTTTAG